MKKFITTTIVIATLVSSSSALAKTAGNYVGVDFLRVSAKAKSNSNLNRDTLYYSEFYSHNNSDSSFGVGLNYKHAFNFDGFFVSPGIFVENLGTTIKSGRVNPGDALDGYEQSLKLNNRLGLRVDLGYDITDGFSAYIPVGFNRVGYEMKTNDYSHYDEVQTKKTDSKTGYFYGLGASYALNGSFSVNAEYNKLQKLKLRSVSQATLGGGTMISNADVSLFKVGVAYHF